jgi:hypothetical protein
MNGPNKLDCLLKGKPFRPLAMQHSSLLGPFGYDENELLWAKAHLHYSENRANQVRFKEQKKNILHFLNTNFVRFLP